MLKVRFLGIASGFILVVLLLTPSLSAHANILKCTNNAGTVLYTNDGNCPQGYSPQSVEPEKKQPPQGQTGKPPYSAQGEAAAPSLYGYTLGISPLQAEAIRNFENSGNSDKEPGFLIAISHLDDDQNFKLLLKFRNDVLESITAFYPEYQSTSITNSLVEKYGEPTRVLRLSHTKIWVFKDGSQIILGYQAVSLDSYASIKRK